MCLDVVLPGRYGAAGGIQKQIGRGRYQTNIAL
ncbi:MAG: hypothetical protein ACI8T1_002937, partial [Verrucomicrobiales bacterium]